MNQQTGTLQEVLPVELERPAELATESRVFAEVTSRIHSPRRAWTTLGLMIALYVCLFWMYYPPLPGVEDEIGFINQGVLFSAGHVSAEGAGYENLVDFELENGHHVTKRNPGISLLLVPLLWTFGPKSVFWSGALIHVALTLLAAVTLQAMGYSVLWAALVLCHPTLAIYSRTVMGGEGAAFGLLLALYAVVACRRPGWWAGLAVGLAGVMRYYAAAVLPFAAVAIALTPSIENRRREALKCLVAGGISGLALFAYNRFMYGDVIGHREIFSPRAFPAQLAVFVAGLGLIWPGMLAAPFLNRSRERLVTHAFVWPIAAIFLPYGFFDRGSNCGQTLVLGQRLLLPMLGVWIVCYAGVAEEQLLPALRRRVRRRARQVAVAICLTAMLLGTGAIFRAHQQHLRQFERVQAEVARRVPRGSIVLANSTLAKLFGLTWQAEMYRMVIFTQESRFTAQSQLDLEGRHFYLVELPKYSPNEFGSDIPALVRHYGLQRIATAEPELLLYEAQGTRSPAGARASRNEEWPLMPGTHGVHYLGDAF